MLVTLWPTSWFGAAYLRGSHSWCVNPQPAFQARHRHVTWTVCVLQSDDKSMRPHGSPVGMNGVVKISRSFSRAAKLTCGVQCPIINGCEVDSASC